jgi:S1-C subfamily serine protease
VLRLPAKQGVLVAAVKPGSPAAKAGIVGGTTQVVVAGESYELGGDMIVAVGGKDVTSVDQLRDMIAAHKPGDTVSVTVVNKDGKRSTKSVELARMPENPNG